jgi:hypothetical protein
MYRRPLVAAATALSLLMAGCHAAEPATERAVAAAAGPVLPVMTVHKHPDCGCCGVWVEHMREAGFEVAERNVADMGPIKQAVGVPYAMGSCHTAEVGGYFVEGHVPAEDVLRLLRERPAAKGLTVPGMPLGSPGMEHPDGLVQPYTVSLVLADGSVRTYSQHPRD